jgi:arylsulfatase A-like enzyme
MLFNRIVIGIALLAMLVPLLAQAPVNAQVTAPNIVVIVFDDMRSTDWVALPNTRALLSGGTWYENYYATTPLCCPSRVSILTGKYSHNHRVLKNEGRGGGFNAFRNRQGNTLATWLQGVGYRTALIGKYLNGYKSNSNKPSGWSQTAITSTQAYYDFTLNENGRPHDYKRKKKKTRRNRGNRNPYVTDVLRTKSIKFIQQTPDVQPLFLYVGMRAPHAPAEPARRHRGLYRGAKAAKTPAFNHKLAGGNLQARHLTRLKGKDIRGLNQLERQRLQSMAAADEMVLAIWQTLAAEGRLDNTYIFVVSDNGMMMGEHRFRTKGVVYDHSVRIPMIVWGPDPEFQQGLSSPENRLVGNVDIAPTISEIVGLPFDPAAFDGISLLSGDVRDAILLESLGAKVTGFQAIRTQRYLYVHNLNGIKELYDKVVDPYEMHNIANGGAGVPPDLVVRLNQLKGCAGAGCH